MKNVFAQNINKGVKMHSNLSVILTKTDGKKGLLVFLVVLKIKSEQIYNHKARFLTMTCFSTCIYFTELLIYQNDYL